MKDIVVVDSFTDVDLFLMWGIHGRNTTDRRVRILGTKAEHLSARADPRRATRHFRIADRREYQGGRERPLTTCLVCLWRPVDEPDHPPNASVLHFDDVTALDWRLAAFRTQGP